MSHIIIKVTQAECLLPDRVRILSEWSGPEKILTNMNGSNKLLEHFDELLKTN